MPIPTTDGGDPGQRKTGRGRRVGAISIPGILDRRDDDGSGIMATFQAVALTKSWGCVRGAPFGWFCVNEENGGGGGRAYREMVGDAVKDHVAAIEMDGGRRTAWLGFGVMGEVVVSPASGGTPLRLPDLPPLQHRRLLFCQSGGDRQLLEPIEAGQMSAGGGGSDIKARCWPLVFPVSACAPSHTLLRLASHQRGQFRQDRAREFQLNEASLAVLRLCSGGHAGTALSDLK